MRQAITIGQHPDQVVASVIRQIRRARQRPKTRILMMQIMKPYLHRGHSDLNGDRLVEGLHAMARSREFFREPAGPDYPGEVVTTPEIAYSVGGDCDDMAVLIGTAASVFGLDVAIGREITGENTAHIVAAVRRGWYEKGDEWIVIDPQKIKPTEPVAGSRWQGV